MTATRDTIRDGLISRGFTVTDLAMQTQAHSNGRLLGGVNDRHVYVVSNPVRDTGVEAQIEELGFAKKRQPWRFWWQATLANELGFFAALELVRAKLSSTGTPD